jgi:hypothetical protein
MAGQGPAPAEKRRRANEPARGDWVDLPPLEKPVLPTLPKRTKAEGSWPAMTKAAWTAWRRDPVTAQYSEADIAYALDTIRLHALVAEKPQLAAEVRLRMDALGLTPKGKRDLRWRIGREEAQKQQQDPPRRRRGSDRRARLELVK